jgi:hypothetical protein
MLQGEATFQLNPGRSSRCLSGIQLEAVSAFKLAP